MHPFILTYISFIQHLPPLLFIGIQFCGMESEVSSVYGNYTWPGTRISEEFHLPCTVGVSGNFSYATRVCLTNGIWTSTDFSQCLTIVEGQLLMLQDRINNVSIHQLISIDLLFIGSRFRPVLCST